MTALIAHLHERKIRIEGFKNTMKINNLSTPVSVADTIETLKQF